MRDAEATVFKASYAFLEAAGRKIRPPTGAATDEVCIKPLASSAFGVSICRARRLSVVHTGVHDHPAALVDPVDPLQ